MMAGETDCTAEPRRVEWKIHLIKYLLLLKEKRKCHCIIGVIYGGYVERRTKRVVLDAPPE